MECTSSGASTRTRDTQNVPYECAAQQASAKPSARTAAAAAAATSSTALARACRRRLTCGTSSSRMGCPAHARASCQITPRYGACERRPGLSPPLQLAFARSCKRIGAERTPSMDVGSLLCQRHIDPASHIALAEAAMRRLARPKLAQCER